MTLLSKCTKSSRQCRQIEVILRHFTQAMASRSTSLLFLRFDYKSLASSLHRRNKVWHTFDSMALNVKRIIAIQDWGTSDGKFCVTRFSAPTVFVKITFSLIRGRKDRKKSSTLWKESSRWWFRGCASRKVPREKKEREGGENKL